MELARKKIGATSCCFFQYHDRFRLRDDTRKIECRVCFWDVWLLYLSYSFLSSSFLDSLSD